jgi:hypothetical protein
MNTTQRRSFGRRINAWLDEPDGEQFTDGKWRFWLPAVLGFSILNAALTVMIFRETASANYLTPALLAASGIVGWIAIGCLHYSDAKRGRMARGVSALDSASLLFTLGHFCFLVYILGHGWILRGADADYKAALKEYNANAQAFHAGNEKIADALRDAEAARKETAKIEQDTAYQLRQAAKHGARINTQRAGGITANIEMAKVELPPPPKAPEDSQAAFLTRWDAWVRITNFGELILAAITLIFIRNWTAKANTPARRDDEDFPSEFDADVVQDHRTGRRFDQTRKSDSRRQSPASAISTDRKEALKALRAHLKAIAFYCPGFWFRADLIDGGVSIRMFRRREGLEETVALTRQSDKLLTAVNRPDFRKRLVDELIHQAFPIEKHAPT